MLFITDCGIKRGAGAGGGGHDVESSSNLIFATVNLVKEVFSILIIYDEEGSGVVVKSVLNILTEKMMEICLNLMEIPLWEATREGGTV